MSILNNHIISNIQHFFIERKIKLIFFGSAIRSQHLRTSVNLCLLILPWLNPFSPGPSPSVIPLLFSWACAGLLLLSVSTTPHTIPAHHWCKLIAWSWMFSACANAAIGLLQYHGFSAWATPWLNNTHAGEAFGNLRQRNQFATLLNIGLAAALWLHTQVGLSLGRLSQTTTYQQRYFFYALLLAMVCLAFANAASASRTGLLQLILLLVMTNAWERQNSSKTAVMGDPFLQSHLLMLALLAYISASFALPWIAGFDPTTTGAFARLRSGDTLCSSRLTLWRNVLHLIEQKPWTGWGWGELDYAHFITLYPGDRFCDILDNAHNLPLHIAVELGLPVAALLMLGCLVILWLAKPWRESRPVHQLAWSVLALIGFHSLLEYPLWYGPFQMAALLCLGLLVGEKYKATSNAWTHASIKLCQHLMPTFAVLIIVVCGVVAWNYHLASQIYLTSSDRIQSYKVNTLEKLKTLTLFQDQVQFAKLTTTELTATNAQEIHDLALKTLHFSPEARVAELMVDSCIILNRLEEMRFYAARYQAAFPENYNRWIQRQKSKPANVTKLMVQGYGKK